MRRGQRVSIAPDAPDGRLDDEQAFLDLGSGDGLNTSSKFVMALPCCVTNIFGAYNKKKEMLEST